MDEIDFDVDLAQPQVPDTSTAPVYNAPVPIATASLHNEAAAPQQGSWLGSIMTSVGNAPKYLGLSAASAGIGLANTAIAVSNWVSQDKTEEIDMQKWLYSYDTDLGNYYRDNQAGIDTVGFLLGSIVPGTAGVKVLNVGQKALVAGAQTGAVGGSMRLATNLLVPQTGRYMAEAAEAIAASRTGFRLLQANTAKSLASGFHQNVLEAAAFEAFAFGANFKSSFYDNMEAGDIASNMLMGLGLGGAIGGVLSGFKITSGIRKRAVELDKITDAGVSRAAVPDSLPPSSKAAVSLLNRESQEIWLLRNQAGPQPGAVLPDGVTADLLQAKAANIRRDILAENNAVRTQVRALAGNDDVGNVFADAIIQMPSRDAANMMLGTDKLVRVHDVAASRAKPSKTQGTLDLGLESVAAAVNERISWNKLWGANAGKTFDELPTVAKLADTVPVQKGKTIQEQVDKVIKSFKHSSKKSENVALADKSLAQVQARYAASKSFKLEDSITALQGDFPLLEAALRKWDSEPQATMKISIKNGRGKVIKEVTGRTELLDEIIRQKDIARVSMLKRNKSVEEIAERLNMSPDAITGIGVSTNKMDDYFYHQSQARALKIPEKDLFYKPSFMGVKVADDLPTDKLTEMHLDAELLLAQQRDAAQASIDASVAYASSYLGQAQLADLATGAKTSGNLIQLAPSNKELREAITMTNRLGSGARFLTFANGNYGSAESVFQYIGKLKNEMDNRGVSAMLTEFESAANKIRTDTRAAAEVSAINELVARSPIRYGVDPTTSRLIPLKHIDELEAGVLPGELSKLPEGVRAEIPIKSEAALEFLTTHIRLNQTRLEGKRAMWASLGKEYTVDSRGLYPIKPDPKNFPYHAMVTDPTITGAGKTTMIHASSKEELDALIGQVESQFPQWKVYTKNQLEDYKKALGQFEYDLTLHDNYIDTSLASKGINSQTFPQTNGSLVAEKFINWHGQQVRNHNADIIKTKYNAEFKELSNLGRNFDNLSLSKYPDATAMALHKRDNPYLEYMKTALNVSNLKDYPLLTTVGEYLDSFVSIGWNKAAALWQGMKGVDQNTLDQISKAFDDVGFKPATYTAATHLHANHPAGGQVLSRFIRGANSILATTFLRLDPLNALNNKIGSVILTSSELRHVVKSIEAGNADAVGKLANLAKVKVPGTDKSMLSPTKLQMRAWSNFFNDRKLVQRAIDEGFVPQDVTDAFRVVDSLTIKGDETPFQLNKKLAEAVETAKKAAGVGEKLTGNSLIEKMNRFVAYDVMRQVTDLGVGAGVISAKEARTYINTFINRTQVNLVASQRPLVFQGPIGMAIGLFQSYQFNLMQQLFRYIGEGQAKSAAYLMGLQGSFYGLNGLPGFQAFNEHIIGQAAGNHEHNDIISSLYKSAGYDAANFFLYGLPSNLLEVNLYSRGDLTPQNPTILPTALKEIPLVSMYSRFFGNLFTVGSNLASGADITESLLQGLEHNSLNRPLAGIAQTLRGLRNGNVYSTDRNSNILASNDLYSLATLARIAGGRPLDEALVRDEKYRINAYKQADREAMASATRALRVSLADSGTASSAQIDSVLDLYLSQGKKIDSFNKFFMNQYIRANTGESEKLRNSLGDPYSYRMQVLMGGGEANGIDFSLQ